MIDLVSRAAIVAIFGAMATLKAMVAVALLQDSILTLQVALSFASQLASLAFAALVIFMTFVRLRPISTLQGWEPRFSAFMGTFLTCLLPLMPQTDVPDAIQVVSIMLVTLGFSMAVWVVRWLGRSLSVTAQARKLVRQGPYALVRHPLYLAEEVAIIGLILSHISPEAMLLGAIHWCFQLRRMANEERLLRATFLEYESYAASVPMLIPRLAAERELSLGSSR
jgi:protein-S-isoprenylcysteine O-methyltransferase Ste14